MRQNIFYSLSAVSIFLNSIIIHHLILHHTHTEARATARTHSREQYTAQRDRETADSTESSTHRERQQRDTDKKERHSRQQRKIIIPILWL